MRSTKEKKSNEILESEILTEFLKRKSIIQIKNTDQYHSDFYHDISYLSMAFTNSFDLYSNKYFLSKKRLKSVLSTEHYQYLVKKRVKVNHFKAETTEFVEYNQYYFDRLFYLPTIDTYIIDDLVMIYDSDLHYSDFANYSIKEQQKLIEYWSCCCSHLSIEQISETTLRDLLMNMKILQ